MVKQFLSKFSLLMLTMLVGGSVCAQTTQTAGFSLASTTTVPLAANANPKTTTISGNASETWNVEITGTWTSSSMQGNTGSRYWQMGANGAAITSAKFSTSGISGTISSIVVNCASYQGKGTISATVGGSAFGTQSQSVPSWGNNKGGNITFSNNSGASGTIEITMTNGSGGRAMYIQSITVTYTASTDSRASSNLAWSESSASVTYSETPYNLPTLSYEVGVTGITYESSNTSVATIDASGNVTINNVTGSSVIKAIFEGNDEFKPATATYTLNVTKKFIAEDGVFDFTFGEGYGSGVTPTNDGQTYIEDATTWTAGNVTMVIDGKYRMWSSNSSYDLRIYGTSPQSTLKLNVPSGNVITKVKFNTNVNLSPDKGTLSSGEWEGVANEVTFTYAASSGAVTIKSINVTYGPAVTVGDSKFTSVYYSDKDLKVPTGLTAYTFTVGSDNKLAISQTIEAGEVIAKDQAVVLYGEKGDYGLEISTGGTKDVNNVLRGFDEAQTTTGGTVYYRLTTKGGDPSTIGFYWGAENGGAFTVGAHKAYVAVDAALSFGAGARMADIFAFDEANGIDNVDGETITNNRYFDLQGRRIAQPTKGLYIVNGKKMLVK